MKDALITKGQAPNKTVHVMPCEIKHDGPANVSSFFIVEKVTINGEQKVSSTFRGRRLFAKEANLPEGYKGCIYKETAKRIVTEGTNDENNENASPSNDHEVQYQTIAEFDKFHVWEHDEEPCTKREQRLTFDMASLLQPSSGPVKKSTSGLPAKPTSLRAEIVHNLIHKCLEDYRTALDLNKKLVGLEFPKNITILQPCLTHLNLSENELVSLPDSISQLTNLTSLDLSSNMLTVIPAQIFKLTLLQELNISNNEIKIITGEITVLKELETFVASKNMIIDVTPRLTELLNLRDLDLSHNDIVFLPSEFCNFKKLKSLDVRANPLQFPPKSVADKGIDSILSFLGDKTYATISRNENRYSTLKQALKEKGAKRRTTAFSLNAFAYNNGEINAAFAGGANYKGSATAPGAIPEDEELTLIEPVHNLMPKRNRAASVVKNATMKKQQTVGIAEPLLEENMGNVASQLNNLRDTRKKIIDARTEAMNLANSGTSNQQVKEVETLDRQHGFENSLSSMNEQIKAAMDKNDSNFLMNLAQQRNNVRIQYVKDLRSSYNEMIQKAYASPEDVLNKLDSVSRSDQAAFSKVSTLINKTMKKTNEAAKVFLQAIEEESAVLEMNREWIIKIYQWFYATKARENLLNVEKIGNMSKKIAYFEALRMAELVRVPTPTQVATMIKLFIDLSSETDENAKMGLFSRAVDSMVASAATVLTYEVNLAHQIEVLAESEYPEMKALYPDLVSNVTKNANTPFVNYRFDDYEELIPMDSDSKQSVGVNMYGMKCIVKKLPVNSIEQAEQCRRVIDFLYKHRHSNITPVYAAWFEDDHLFVEEQLVAGITLRDWMEKNPFAPFQKVREILYDVLQALAFLHRYNFCWGSISSESIIMVQDETDPESIRPVLGNFDYLFGEQLNDTDPPEAQEAGRKLYTRPSDMFYFGQLVCEVMSTDHLVAVFKRKENGKKDYDMPQLSAKYASKHLHILVQDLISCYPEKRICANAFIHHPYFKVDRDPTSASDQGVKTSRLNRFYMDLFACTISGGVLLAEMEPSAENNDIVKQWLTLGQFTPFEELDFKKVMVYSTEGVYEDYVKIFFEQISEISNDYFIPVSRELPHSKFVMPNSSFTDFKKLETIGIFLRRWASDGYSIPSIFPPVFFKMLLGKTLTNADYETCYPFDSTRRYAASTAYQDDMNDLIKTKFTDALKQQMGAISKGFFAGQMELTFRSLSALDVAAFLHGRCNDQLSGSLLRQMTSVDGFDLDANTLDFYWMWIDSLSDSELRKFLFYVCGRYALSEIPALQCGHANYVLEHSHVPLIHLHLSYQSIEVQRPLVHHLEIPPCQDYVQLQQSIVKAMNEFLQNEDLQERLE